MIFILVSTGIVIIMAIEIIIKILINGTVMNVLNMYDNSILVRVPH